MAAQNYRDKFLSNPTKQLVITGGVVFLVLALIATTAFVFYTFTKKSQPDSGLQNFRAKPYLATQYRIRSATAAPAGLQPATIKSVYNLPSGNVGSGTIAIVDAYDDPNIEADLAIFDQQFGLAACTTSNGCFTKVKIKSRIAQDTGWGQEESLDVEWAHAIAPGAKIALVEAASDSGPDLLAAVSFAEKQPGVTAVSMSWGGGEFPSETQYDSSFKAERVQFFAAAGDNGHGSSWPAASANVIAVGGTTLNFDKSGNLSSETAWSGSGGGISSYITEPNYQKSYGVSNTNGKRGIPDVSYNADPASGYSVYDSFGRGRSTGWLAIGGTSAGAPQWAAIQALGKSVNATTLYSDASYTNASKYFRDVVSGSDGTCGSLCRATTGYDEVTGLGSPLTKSF